MLYDKQMTIIKFVYFVKVNDLLAVILPCT